MAVDIPKVFVSYAHESDEHKAQVLAFATFLRQAGIEAVLDLWSPDARLDWYSWAIREMTEADFVLVVASDRYRQTGDGSGPNAEHRGVQSETALLRELVYADQATWLPKMLPVLLPGHTVDQIPLFLQPHAASRFHVTSFDPAGAEDLLRVVLRQPGHLPPEVGTEQPTLPPHLGRTDQVPLVGPTRVVNQITGMVFQTGTDSDSDSDEYTWTEPGGGVDTVQRTGSLSVSVYLSDEGGHEAVEAAVTRAMELAGAPIVERDNPVFGSWFRRMRAHPSIREIGVTAAHVAETHLVHAPDAQVTALLLQHIGPVIAALNESKNAVVRLGAVLIVKIDDQLVVHQLTAAQQFQLDRQPQLAMEPRNVLKVLELPSATNGHRHTSSTEVEGMADEGQ